MPPPPSQPSHPTLSRPISSSDGHPLSILTRTLLASPLSANNLAQSSATLLNRIAQSSYRHRSLARLESLRAHLATSLQAGGTDKDEWARRYTQGLVDFETDWDAFSSSFTLTSSIWSKLPSFSSKLAAGGVRVLLEDPFRTGKQLASLGATAIENKIDGGGSSEVAVVLDLVSSILGPEGVLMLVEGFSVGIVQELVGEEEEGGASNPARERELEGCFVAMMGLVHDRGLEVVFNGSQEVVIGSPFAFSKSLELILLETLATSEPSPIASDLPPRSSSRPRVPPSHPSSISQEGGTLGWGATFSSMILGSPPQSPGAAADFPWSQRGGWAPAGPSAAPVAGAGGTLRTETKSISGPSPILKSPIGGRMFRSPSLSSFRSSSLVDSSPTSGNKSFTSLATSILRTLSKPPSSSDATSTPISSRLPLLQALSISLLRTHFPFTTHQKSHRRVLLLLVVRWYSFHLLQRVLTGSTTSPSFPLPSRGVALTSVQGRTPTETIARRRGMEPPLGDVWKGEKGGAKLDMLHLRVHLALVEGSLGSSSARSRAADGEEEEEELRRAARRVVEAFGAGLRSSSEPTPTEEEDTSKFSPRTSAAPPGIEIFTLNALEIRPDELSILLRVSRPLVKFSSRTEGSEGLAAFRRGSDFSKGSKLAGAGGWGATPLSEPTYAEEDFELVQAGITRLAAESSFLTSVTVFAFPSPAQKSFSISFAIPEVERLLGSPMSSPSMGRTLGSVGMSGRVGVEARGRAASSTSVNSPTMSPSMDGGADYFGLTMVLEEPSEEGDIGKVEKEIIFRALLSLIKEGHLSTSPSSEPVPELVPLLRRAADTSQERFDFANALAYRQALKGLTQVANNHPHLSLHNFASLISSLIAPAVAAEASKAAQLGLARTRLLEVDQYESALLLTARRLLSTLNDLRTRAYFALEVLPSERIADLRSTLGEVKYGEVHLDEDGAVSTWLAETNLAVDFSVGDDKLHAACFAVERVLRRIADPQVLFKSSLWQREAPLAGPFLDAWEPFVVIPTSPTPVPSYSCLSFGAIPPFLLQPGEPRTPQLSYLNAFILRLRTRLTGFLLADLESHGDLTFPSDAWFEKEAHLLLDGPSSISSSIPSEWTSPLLQTLLLHPSPHMKLQALYSLEMLCVNQKLAPFSYSSPETTGLPTSVSFASTVGTTPPRHTLRSPKSTHSPTLHRISRAIDNHQSSSNEAGGGGSGGTTTGGVVPDAIWSLGASLSSYVFGSAPPTSSSTPKLDAGAVRQSNSSSSLVEPPNTDELVEELSRIVLRDRTRSLPSSLIKIAFFVPGEILDFRPEGKAFLDFGLACLTLHSDLLTLLRTEAKDIVRKGAYATREERARAVENLEVCLREGGEGNEEARALMRCLKGVGGA